MADEMPVNQNVPKQVNLAIEKQTLASTIKTMVIPANGLFPVSEYGERFYFIKCSAQVMVKTEHSSEKPYQKGQGEYYTDLKMWFRRLEVRNPNNFDVYVRLWVGFGEFLDSTSELVETPAVFYAWNANTIAASTTVVFLGRPSGVQLQRKAFNISNMDLVNDLFIMDVDPVTGLAVNTGLAVFAKTSITLWGSVIKIFKNPLEFHLILGVVRIVLLSQLNFELNLELCFVSIGGSFKNLQILILQNIGCNRREKQFSSAISCLTVNASKIALKFRERTILAFLIGKRADDTGNNNRSADCQIFEEIIFDCLYMRNASADGEGFWSFFRSGVFVRHGGGFLRHGGGFLSHMFY